MAIGGEGLLQRWFAIRGVSMQSLRGSDVDGNLICQTAEIKAEISVKSEISLRQIEFANLHTRPYSAAGYIYNSATGLRLGDHRLACVDTSRQSHNACSLD